MNAIRLNTIGTPCKVGGNAGGGNGGGGSASSVEYIDVSGEISAQKKTAILQHSYSVKGSTPYGDMTGMSLYTHESMGGGEVSAIIIDFNAPIVANMEGQITKMSVRDSLIQGGWTQAELDALPRLTKEQFYNINE